MTLDNIGKFRELSQLQFSKINQQLWNSTTFVNFELDFIVNENQKDLDWVLPKGPPWVTDYVDY